MFVVGIMLLYIINCTTCCRRAVRSFLLRIIENQEPFDAKAKKGGAYSKTAEYHDDDFTQREIEMSDEAESDDRL